MAEEKFMKRCIELALKGRGYTNPNPLVGAVIVKNGTIIGEGFHEKYGELHAERNAIANCNVSPEGATLYVTLEPCCHYGKTPPCTEAIIEAGIKEVVYGSSDPNPQVNGKGAEALRAKGIAVTANFMESECDSLNPIFFHYIKEKKPYIALKYAMTADGKIATVSGDSKWITEKKARRHVHGLRHSYSGIMVGIGTVLADDPLLTCRLKGGVNPTRIICDSHLWLPLDSQICRTAKEVPTIVATASDDFDQVCALEELGITVLTVPDGDGKVDLEKLLVKLGEMGIDSILVEGGGTLNYSFVAKGLVNRVYVYIGAKIFGGELAKTPVGGDGFNLVSEGLSLGRPKVKALDNDILLSYEVI